MLLMSKEDRSSSLYYLRNGGVARAADASKIWIKYPLPAQGLAKKN